MTAEQDQAAALMRRIHAANRMDRSCTNLASTYAIGYIAQAVHWQPGLLDLLTQAVTSAEQYVQTMELDRARRAEERAAGRAS